jgi:hypothetical protein
VNCYFYATSHAPKAHVKGPGIISFCVPDLGFTYRAALRATPSEFPYRAVLALIRFLESNRKVWHRQNLKILTDCAPIVYQVQGEMTAPMRVRSMLGTVNIKKHQLGFTLHWVPMAENQARENITRQPLARPALELNFSSLQDTTLVQRASQWKKSDPKESRPNS